MQGGFTMKRSGIWDRGPDGSNVGTDREQRVAGPSGEWYGYACASPAEGRMPRSKGPSLEEQVKAAEAERQRLAKGHDRDPDFPGVEPDNLVIVEVGPPPVRETLRAYRARLIATRRNSPAGT